ncbi:MAG: ComEC/Rec2 family competence protein, partial [Pseudomonadales bacterium]|nr:ComEC/Rec2 family competence protein [Pseudomonadales bacterium]
MCNHFALFSFFSISTYFKLPLNLIFDISILFLLGMLYAQWQAANQLSTRLPSSLDGSDATVTGTIISIIERRPSQGYGKQDFYQRFLFEVNDFVVDSNGDLDSTREISISDYQPRLLQINNYQYLDLKSRQQWQFILRLKQPRGNSNPGGFDYLRYLLTQRIDATAYIRDPKTALFIDAGQASFTNKIRASRIESLEALLQQLTNKGLLKALLFGDRSSLNASDRALLQRTGTSHLLAISGLHIVVAALFAAIIVRGFLWLMPRLMHYWARSLIIALVALPVASFYAIVAGFSLSTRRALIMLSCYLLLLALRRQTYFLQTLTLTALLIVVIDPLAVLSAGFWFSFSAVAILLWAGRSIRFSADFKQKFKVFILAQLAIFIAMPLVLFLFT